MIFTYTNGDFFENTYLLTNDLNEGLLIDPGEGIDKYLDEINKFEIKGILLTHGHLDHIDGIKYFKDLPIYIYKDEVSFLNDSNKSLYKYFNKHIPFNSNELNVIELEEGIINLLGYSIQIIHTKGHTIGSCCYLVDNKYLFSGDTLFQCSIGRTDFPTGNNNDLTNSLNKLKLLDDSIKIYPGHGVETTISFEKKYNPYFR